jgi:hypothetical protein
MLIFDGRLKEALSLEKQCSDLCEKNFFRSGLIWATAIICQIYLLQGDIVNAQAMEPTLAECYSDCTRQQRALIDSIFAHLSIIRGNLKSSMDSLERMILNLKTVHFTSNQALIGIFLAVLAAYSLSIHIKTQNLDEVQSDVDNTNELMKQIEAATTMEEELEKNRLSAIVAKRKNSKKPAKRKEKPPKINIFNTSNAVKKVAPDSPSKTVKSPVIMAVPELDECTEYLSPTIMSPQATLMRKHTSSPSRDKSFGDANGSNPNLTKYNSNGSLTTPEISSPHALQTARPSRRASTMLSPLKGNLSRKSSLASKKTNIFSFVPMFGKKNEKERHNADLEERLKAFLPKFTESIKTFSKHV